MSATRRTLLLAAAGLAAGAPAARAETDEGGLLLGLWRREMNATSRTTGSSTSIRCSTAAPARVGPRRGAGHRAGRRRARARRGAPEALSDSTSTAERLARTRAPRGDLPAAGALEQELVDALPAALPALPDAKIAMTAATILASHSQHLLMLPREDCDARVTLG